MCASEIIEDLGLTVGERAIQKAINRYLGPRPSRPPANDSLRRRVVAHMVNVNHLNPQVCYECGKFRASEPYIRALRQDDSLDSLVFVARCCKRAGDL